VSELVYLTRKDWGVNADIDAQLRRRYTRAGNEVVCGQIHHTASIDGNDSTPNRWDFDEAVRYTRALQYARPDLMPMPYNETVAVSEDLNTVWCFEGCGLYTVGAHTSNHNRHGYGISVYGNFDRRDDAARDVVLSAVNQRMTHLKVHAFPRLGAEKSPRGWPVWGHRDSANKSCPGSLYPSIPTIVTLEADMFTAHEETELKGIIASLDSLTPKSNGGFAAAAVQHLRNHRCGAPIVIDLDELAARVVAKLEIRSKP
jgi:hypothetical protein